MSPYIIIAAMAAVCALIVLFMFNVRAFRALGKLCLRGIAGGVGVWAVNAVLALAGVVSGVGINALTVFFTALLGIPGFITIYAVQFLLPK